MNFAELMVLFVPLLGATLYVGDVYRRQTFAQVVDPTLTLEDLETLAERLNLPEGWMYRAKVLSENRVTSCWTAS